MAAVEALCRCCASCRIAFSNLSREERRMELKAQVVQGELLLRQLQERDGTVDSTAVPWVDDELGGDEDADEDDDDDSDGAGEKIPLSD